MTVYYTIYKEWFIADMESLKEFINYYEIKCDIPEEYDSSVVGEIAARVDESDFLYEKCGEIVRLVDFFY